MEPVSLSPFEYTTKYLENREELLEKANLANGPRFLKALNEGKWTDPIFERRSQFPFLALYYFKSGEITKGQFTTVMLYWSILRHHSHIEVLPCSVDLNHDLMKQTFMPPKELAEATNGGMSLESHLTPDQEATFFSLMRDRDVPESERYFFLIPDYQYPPDGEYSISQYIAYETGINVFNRVQIDGKTQRMIPSHGMMQAFVKALTGKDFAVDMTPVIGLSSLEDIRDNSLTGTRDMAIPIQGVDLPPEVDNHSCPQFYDVTYHDFYHAILSSLVPPHQRKAFMAIEKVVANFRDEVTEDIEKRFLTQFSERLIDMELPSYRRETVQHIKGEFPEDYSIDLVFWDAMRDLILQTHEHLHTDETQKLQKQRGYSHILAKIKANDIINRLKNEHNLIPQIAERILSSVSFEEHGISLNSINTIKPFFENEIIRGLKKEPSFFPLRERFEKVVTRDLVLELNRINESTQIRSHSVS